MVQYKLVFIRFLNSNAGEADSINAIIPEKNNTRPYFTYVVVCLIEICMRAGVVWIITVSYLNHSTKTIHGVDLKIKIDSLK